MSTKRSAFGIEPGRKPYRLRLAKYYAIGESVGKWAADAAQRCPTPAIIDVGGDEGRVFRYIEAFLGEDRFQGTIVDLFPKGTERVFHKERRKLIHADLNLGLPMIESNTYDIVICEQVMEHLEQPELLSSEFHRILKPGGLGIFGVPCFPPGLCWIRKHVIPWIDQKRGKVRAHQQAFTLGDFSAMLARNGGWRVLEKRGFRIVSGGVLSPLENYRWWWLCNRWVGSKVPSLCIEAQVLLQKPGRREKGGGLLDTLLSCVPTSCAIAPELIASVQTCL